MCAFIHRKIRGKNSRTARFESLENRLLLTASRGLDAAAFDAIQADWPGFDYSGIVAENVLVVDATDGIDAQALRQAIADAKTSAGPDLIVVQTGDADATIRFSSADDVFKIDDSSPLTIVATGPKKLTIDADAKSRIFEVSSASNLALGSLVLTGGSAVDGGAVRSSGTLFLDGVCVASNVASGKGGGIYSESELTVVNSIITDNRAGGDGGGVYAGGVYVANAPMKQTTFIACDVVGNEAGVGGNGFGGGIYFAGQDADFKIFAEMRLDASIVVQNRSTATECDVNIYNSAFYNEFTFDGEKYVFEIPIAALIDGDYNVTSFTYWVSSYNPDDLSDVGTNVVYNEAAPLFTRDYNFETATIGDYTLYESPISQAIDKVPLSAVAYPNGRALVRDYQGNRRVQNGALDAGALEVWKAQADLATRDGAQASAKATVVGGKLRLEGVEVSNLSELDVDEFKIEIFASGDLNFDEADVKIGEIDARRLLANSTQHYRSQDLATEYLAPGAAYYLGWRVVSSADPNDANDWGATSEPVAFYAENDAEITTAPLESENYRTQRDSAFYLAVSQEVAEQFSDGYSYWWDYGDGRYVEGAASAWAAPTLPESGDAFVVALKIVDDATGKVVAKGNAALEALATAPTIACDVAETSNDSLLVLSLTAQGAGRAIAQWQISWGDGSTSTFDALGTELTVGKSYATAAQAKTYAVSLTVVEAGSQARKTTYKLLDFKVAGTESSAVLTAETDADAFSAFSTFSTFSNEATLERETAPNVAAEVERSNALATTEERVETPFETPRVDAASALEKVAAERDAFWALTDEATREFWKRRRDETSPVDESDERLEIALELLALNALR